MSSDEESVRNSSSRYFLGRVIAMGAITYTCAFPQGKSVADARQGLIIYARVPHVVALVLQTMNPNSTSDSSSIFKGEKLKSGIYKIQNLYTQTYADIHEHSRDVCCRPATALGEGRGLVRPFQQPVIRVSDD